MSQNGFSLCDGVLRNDGAVCVHTRSKEAHVRATTQLSVSFQGRAVDSKGVGVGGWGTERRASILVLPLAGEIDVCIQDFYTPLIGFTGH